MDENKFSKHARKRMGHRGITDLMVRYVLKHGRIAGDRHVLDRRELRALLDNLTAERSLILKLLDKGGVAVAANGDSIITAMNIEDGRNGH